MVREFQDDPLTKEQKAQMRDAVKKGFFACLDRVYKKNPEMMLFRRDQIIVSSYFSKTYNNPYLEKQTRAIFEYRGFDWEQVKKDFEPLSRMFKNPAIIAYDFKLNVRNKGEMMAAQTYLKAAVRQTEFFIGYPEEYTKELIELSYLKKMTHVPKNIIQKYFADDVSIFGAKNKALLEDPVRDLPELAEGQKHSSADIILANTYVQKLPIPDKDENFSLLLKEILGLVDKKEYLENVIKYMCGDSSRIKHVMDALATLAQKEKANLVMTASSENISSLGDYLKEQTAPVGLYTNRHTVFFSSIFNQHPETKEMYSDAVAVGAIPHEVSHFLFNKIVKNDSSPVVSGKEAEIDRVIEADKEHRKELGATLLSVRKDWLQEQSQETQDYYAKYPLLLLHTFYADVYNIFVGTLEPNNSAYFGDSGFDANNPRHQHIMRAEYAVRVAQSRGMGIPDAIIEHIAPNALEFDNKYTKELFSAYVRGDEVAVEKIKNFEGIKINLTTDQPEKSFAGKEQQKRSEKGDDVKLKKSSSFEKSARHSKQDTELS